MLVKRDVQELEDGWVLDSKLILNDPRMSQTGALTGHHQVSGL